MNQQQKEAVPNLPEGFVVGQSITLGFSHMVPLGSVGRSGSGYCQSQAMVVESVTHGGKLAHLKCQSCGNTDSISWEPKSSI